MHKDEVIYPDPKDLDKRLTGAKAAKTKSLKSRMTKPERINTVISLCALLVSVASPIFTYLWLDPQIQAFRRRGRLQVTPIARQFVTDVSEDELDIKITAFLAPGCGFQVVNVGDLPAKDVSIAIQYEHVPSDKDKIEIDPPLIMESSDSGINRFITLKQSIGPSSKVSFKLNTIPKNIWISNEFGERNLLSDDALNQLLTFNGRTATISKGNINDPDERHLWDSKAGRWKKLSGK